MKTNNNFKTFFLISLVVTLIGAFYKILHWGYAQPILIIGLLFTLLYMTVGIIEVTNSSKIDKSEKIMWTVGFTFFGFITAIVYLLSGRKRIV